MGVNALIDGNISSIPKTVNDSNGLEDISSGSLDKSTQSNIANAADPEVMINGSETSNVAGPSHNVPGVSGHATPENITIGSSLGTDYSSAPIELDTQTREALEHVLIEIEAEENQ